MRIIVIPNALEPRRTEEHEAPELVPWLIDRFGIWPATARLAHRVGGVEYDVTPQVPSDVPALSELDGTAVVRIYPAGIDPITGGVGLLYLGAKKIWDALHPDIPTLETPQRRAQDRGGSPNNSLGARSNTARVGQRIPYILGNVRSIPDMLMVPYTIYEDHVEVEIGYYCVGEGDCSILDIRDGDTLIRNLALASAEVYGPGKAPTGGVGLHEPDEDESVGDAIEDDVYVVYQVDAVNGQELEAFNDRTFYGTTFPQNSDTPLLMSFFDNGDGTGVIRIPFASAADEVTDLIAVGDDLFIFWPFVQAGGAGTAPNLTTPVTSSAGHPVVATAPEVTAISEETVTVDVTVSIPASQQAQWALLQTYFETLQDPSDLFPYTGGFNEYAQVTPLSHLYQGPFFVDFEHPSDPATLEIVCNFVAPRGLYMDDGTTTRALNVNIQVIITPADATGIPSGTPQAFQITLEGSATARGQRAVTLRCKPTGLTSTRVLVQARRLTNTPRRQRQTDSAEESVFGADLDADPPVYAHFSGEVADEIRWTHCYSMSKPGNISFGDVTTIHTRTVGTRGAVRTKNRRLNCFAARKLPIWNGTDFNAPVSTTRAENCLFAAMRANTVGDLDDANIDFEGIATAIQLVRDTIFSATPAGGLSASFSHTFDDANMSAEETFQTICQAVFCTAYRDGDVIKVRPELATDDAVLLLNHRNTTEGSQTITHTFGAPTENDSVEVSYVDTLDDFNTKVVVPKHGSNLRPRQLKVVGLRSSLQAYWHAYRAYFKMLYQRQTMSIEALQEAELVGVRERILVADETRSGTQTGDVLSISGSTIMTSQPVALAGGITYSVRLQQPDGTVNRIAVASAPDSRHLTLVSAPTVIVNPGAGVPTTYLLTADDAPEPSAYLVTSTSPAAELRQQVEAVNYSHMYYVADGLTLWVDFANGLSDLSPQQRSLTNSGGSIGSGVWTGDSTDFLTVTNNAEDVRTASYTSLAWITADDATGNLVCTVDGTSQVFGITVTEIDVGGTPTVAPVLIAGHDSGIQVSANYTDHVEVEHMVAVSYDATTERMALLIDGRLVDEATVDPPPPGNPLRYLEGYDGTCRMIAKWARCLSDAEVMEFYLRTRQ